MLEISDGFRGAATTNLHTTQVPYARELRDLYILDSGNNSNNA